MKNRPVPPPPLCGKCDNRWVYVYVGSRELVEYCPRCHPLGQRGLRRAS